MGGGIMVKLRYLLPLVLVTGLLGLPAGASANPDVASISYAGNAELFFSPGPINVTLHYSCPPPSPGEILAVVVQNAVTGESAPTLATCDGRNHSVTLTVTGLFVPGEAQGLAVVQNANFDTSGIALANQEIMIR
jgi:hypothetical protein